jgi:menaquinone-9 beta-reductase
MTVPIVVAGGGLAGAAAACLLARAGRQVLVIERQAQAADKICGEFISVEAQKYLRCIGIDLAALGAHPIVALRLVDGTSMVSRALPFAGLGLSRRTLDEALLHHAARCGATVQRGQSVSLTRDRNPIVLDIAGGGELRAHTLFLATGKHDLRGLRRRVAGAPDLVGFKLHLRLSPTQRAALAGHVEILLLRDGYAGIQLVEDGQANLCLLVERERLRFAGGTWEGLLEDLKRTEPHLRTRLAGAAAPTRLPMSIFRVPYGFVHAPLPDDPSSIFRLGDQVGVIHSFTGDGMSIALHSAIVAASCYLAGEGAAEYHRRIRRDIAVQIGRADALYRIGGSRLGRAMLMHLAALWPTGLRLGVQLTRVPRWAISRSFARAALWDGSFAEAAE